MPIFYCSLQWKYIHVSLQCTPNFTQLGQYWIVALMQLYTKFKVYPASVIEGKDCKPLSMFVVFILSEVWCTVVKLPITSRKNRITRQVAFQTTELGLEFDI